MRINLAQVNYQVRQLNDQTAVLRVAQSSLLLYQRNLNTCWRGIEMVPTNQLIDDYSNRLASIAADLNSIGNDIIIEAEAIRIAEELAEAQAAAENQQQ